MLSEEAARTEFQVIIDCLGLKQANNGWYNGSCSSSQHHDTKPSCGFKLVQDSKGGWRLVPNCFVPTCTQANIFDGLQLKLNGVELKLLKGVAPESQRSNVKVARPAYVVATVPAPLAAELKFKGLPANYIAMPPDVANVPGVGVVAAQYRFEGPVDITTGKSPKEFRWASPTAPDLWKSGFEGTKDVLYGLSSTPPKGEVILVEGPKTCRAAQTIFPKHHCVATFGAGAFSPTAASYLVEAPLLYIWGDADLDADAIIKKWVDTAMNGGVGQEKIRIVPLDFFPPKWDLANPWPFTNLTPMDLLARAKSPSELAKTLVASDTIYDEIVKTATDLFKVFYLLVLDGETYIVDPIRNRYYSKENFNNRFYGMTSPGGQGRADTYFLTGAARNGRVLDYQLLAPGSPRIFSHPKKGGEALNLWGPTKIIPFPFILEDDLFLPTGKSHKVRFFLEFLYWLFGSKGAKRVIQRIASLVQHPERTHTHHVICEGMEGLGKSLVVQFIVALLGEDNCSPLSESGAMDTFNKQISKYIFMYLNELQGTSKFNVIKFFHKYGADKKVELRAMHKIQEPGEIWTNFWVNTNYYKARIPPNDRRTDYLECVPTAILKVSRYKALGRLLKNKKGMGELLYYFQQPELLEGWNIYVAPPITGAKRKAIDRWEIAEALEWRTKALNLFTQQKPPFDKKYGTFLPILVKQLLAQNAFPPTVIQERPGEAVAVYEKRKKATLTEVCRQVIHHLNENACEIRTTFGRKTGWSQNIQGAEITDRETIYYWNTDFEFGKIAENDATRFMAIVEQYLTYRGGVWVDTVQDKLL